MLHRGFSLKQPVYDSFCEAHLIWASTDSLSVAPAEVAESVVAFSLVRCNDATRTIVALLELIYEIGVILLLKRHAVIIPR